jgi:hypothetical protein
MLHTLSLLRAGCWNGTFLSRFRACADPGFVVQKGLCSVHAEAGRARGFCVVNVKLTLALGAGDEFATVARIRTFGRFLAWVPDGHSGVERIGFFARGGWDLVLDPCAIWPDQLREGFLRALPFRFKRLKNIIFSKMEKRYR